jgi:hypothetical protein
MLASHSLCSTGSVFDISSVMVSLRHTPVFMEYCEISGSHGGEYDV